jgi:hypothetical protein
MEKTALILDPTFSERMDQRMARIEAILEKIGQTTTPEYLSRAEFEKLAQIGSTKFFELKNSGQLKVFHAGPRKLRIPYSELIRFQRGEMNG